MLKVEAKQPCPDMHSGRNWSRRKKRDLSREIIQPSATSRASTMFVLIEPLPLGVRGFGCPKLEILSCWRCMS